MNKAHEYAQALFEITLQVDSTLCDEYVDSFLTLLKEKGHTALLPQIIKKFEYITETEGKKNIVTLTVARESDSNDSKKEAIALHGNLENKAEIDIAVDERIIGGFVLKDSDLVIDASYKNMLINMYRKLIA